MRYILLLSLVLTLSSTAAEMPFGVNEINLPDRFNHVGVVMKNKLLMSDTNSASMVAITIDDKVRAEQHFKILGKVFNQDGGKLNEVKCVDQCKAFYTEFKINKSQRYKSVYLVKSSASYYQIEATSKSEKESRQVAEFLYKQMQEKKIIFEA